ncbi:hypothetical protein P171DRAFT_434526 [Karstenula rhodostoma CBS 690.94]|uniref:Uncharacterized protein n=1 Tax=Karstenula rhodostoma CBS 690.94 TaxID=1392251 RepID=A0A9P4PEY7_9PLEO|nr:hypothetical protein P171DRAFT_434526 [Karstenula rhodostoma CBS 690.94]
MKKQSRLGIGDGTRLLEFIANLHNFLQSCMWPTCSSLHPRLNFPTHMLPRRGLGYDIRATPLLRLAWCTLPVTRR